MKIQSPSKSFILFAAASLIAGCAKDGKPSSPSAASRSTVASTRLAPAAVSASFTALKVPAGSSGPGAGLAANPDNWEITLQRSSLHKAFLLTAMQIESGKNPTPSLLNPKVVSFELSGNQLALFELNAAAVFDDTPSEKLLQTFPVVRQNDATVTFNWSFGVGSVNIVDMNGPAKDHLDDAEPSSEIVSSFVKQVTFLDNQLLLKQVTRVRTRAGTVTDTADPKVKKLESGSEDNTEHLTFVLAPYNGNPAYEPKESPEGKGLGYFTRAVPVKGEGDDMKLATRWDLSPEAGPVTWAITKGAPKEAAQAMAEGILYWNRVAGREIFKVEFGADPDAVPTSRRATVSYSRDDTAGYAYANLASDPFSGEIRSALVFVSSGWYEAMGPEFSRQYLPLKPVGPRGFSGQRLCALPNTDGAGLIKDVKGEGTENLQRVQADILRMVMAHEVGHTLGYRHHFAASLFSKVPGPVEREATFAEYLQRPDHPGAEVSSSVMDYFHIKNDALGGAYIRKNVMSYDSLAFRWGYDAKNPPSQAELAQTLFCTDEDADNLNLVGCTRWDSGTSNPILAEAQDAQIYLSQRLPRQILAKVLDQALPGYGRPYHELRSNVDALNPQSDFTAGLSRSVGLGAKWLRKSAQYVAVTKADLQADWLAGKSRVSASRDGLARLNTEAGGLPGLLKVTFSQEAAPAPGWLKEAVLAVLDKTDFTHAISADGKEVALTESQVKDVRDVTLRYAEEVEKAELRDILLAYTGYNLAHVLDDDGKPDLAKYSTFDGIDPYDPTFVSADWSPKLGAFASDVALRPASTKEFEVNDQKVSVTGYAFRLDARVAALRLLSPAVFGREAGWGTQTATSIRDAIETNLRKVAVAKEGAPHKFQLQDPERASPELRAYFHGEEAFLKALGDILDAKP